MKAGYKLTGHDGNSSKETLYMIGHATKINALIRADGAPHLGMGHITRCLTLARRLSTIGVTSIFVMKDYDHTVIDTVRSDGYEVKLIPHRSDLESDAALTGECAGTRSARMIVTDLSNTDVVPDLNGYREYLRKLKTPERLLVTIDDINRFSFPSDIVINSNYGAEASQYEKGNTAKLLTGAGYFILREELLRSSMMGKDIHDSVHRILITMGGNDLLNLTTRVVNSLLHLDNTDLELMIVLGAAYSNEKKEALLRVINGSTGKCKVVSNLKEMGQVIRWADVAITACGQTKYETAAIGTPSITISQHSYEDRLMQTFKTAGTTEYLGHGEYVSEGDISTALTHLINDRQRRMIMSDNGRQLIDGKGVARIVSAIRNNWEE